jgi:hypothetical protein
LERYIFVGTVRPERTVLSFSTGLRGIDPGSGNEFAFEVSIILSQMRVTVLSQNKMDKFDLRNIVSGILRDLLAQLGFLWGHSYRVEIDRLLSESASDDWVFGIDIEGLAPELTSDEVLTHLEFIRHLVIREKGILIQRALRDLSSAMEEPFDTEFYCYRAIEALVLHHNAVRGKATSKGDAQWKAFRDFSGIEEEGLRRLQRIANDLRHGNVPSVNRDAAFRFESLKCAWDTLRSYLNACAMIQQGASIES